MYIYSYRIARNFRGIKFLRMGPKIKIVDKLFADVGQPDGIHVCVYMWKFANFIFVDVRPTTKIAKILFHKNFPLYGMLYAKSIFPSPSPAGWIRTLVALHLDLQWMSVDLLALMKTMVPLAIVPKFPKACYVRVPTKYLAHTHYKNKHAHHM